MNHDSPLHLWSRVLGPPIDKPRGYGTCGVHIGRFTQNVDQVDCPVCLEIIHAVKESDEPSRPVGQ